MARLYADENFPEPTAQKLRDLGHDVLTTVESGHAGQSIPDEDVLAFSIEQKRILLTLNRKHFIRLHTNNSNHAGIVVCTFDPNFEGLAIRINALLLSTPEFEGQLLRVYRPQQ